MQRRLSPRSMTAHTPPLFEPPRERHHVVRRALPARPRRRDREADRAGAVALLRDLDEVRPGEVARDGMGGAGKALLARMA